VYQLARIHAHMVLVVKIFEQFDLIEFDEESEFGLIDMGLAFEQLLILALDEFHLGL